MMKNVFFYPRVGKNYEKGYKGVKLLILGESHYCHEGCKKCDKSSSIECSDFTIKRINSFIKYKKGSGEYGPWMKTFTCFTNILLEEQVENELVMDFWDSVIFYNYVQSSLKGSRTSPTRKQFEESNDAFFEVLKKYEPDLILVWGKRLWRNLPDTGIWGEKNILDSEPFYYYKVKNKEIPLYVVCHPSTSRFDYTYSKYLKESIRLAKSSKTKY